MTSLRMKLKSFATATNANVSIMLGISMLPIMFGMGMGMDYGMAAKRRAKLDAAADAAVLSAVTPAMMSQTSIVAQVEALNIFNAQAMSVQGVSLSPTNITVTVTDTIVNSSRQRSAVATYNGSSTNAFGAILNMTSIPIGGSSKSSATSAANIDFYLMLDTSPSMGIAATQAGINTMVNATPSQAGCAFACHEANPSADNLGNPGGEDNYQLARNLGVTLRIDLVQQATQNLMTTATADEAVYNAAYRMAGYSFDVGVNTIIPLTSNLTTAQLEAANLTMLEVYDNNNLTNGGSNNDEDTNFDLAFQTMNSNMPSPGNGTNAPGDTPQEILFIVSDGVADENSGGSRIYTPFGAASSTWCQTIKNRNIRIAILYTTYYPLPTNSWYNTYIAAEQPSIAISAMACASPGLFFQVDTGGDISAAMTSLFQTAIATAHLTH